MEGFIATVGNRRTFFSYCFTNSTLSVTYNVSVLNVFVQPIDNVDIYIFFKLTARLKLHVFDFWKSRETPHDVQDLCTRFSCI